MAYCMRKQCLYGHSILLIEIWHKYRMDFPFVLLNRGSFSSLWCFGSWYIVFKYPDVWFNGLENYFIYNHARAYMQDYTGMLDYEENEDFYQSIGVRKCTKSIKSYSYCLYDDFYRNYREKIYNYRRHKSLS